MTKLSILGLSLVSTLFLSSCTSYLTDYNRSDLPYVSSYENAQNYLGASIDRKFWENFSDKNLNTLIEKALDNNYDLRTASVNVEKALLQVDIASTARHPTANASLGSSAQRALSYHDKTQKKSNFDLGFSYQVDLFGKIEAQNLQALESYRATAYDYWAMRLTIIETVATAYWQYAYAKEAVSLGEMDLKDSQKRLTMIKNKYNAGAVDKLDLTNAEVNHINVQRTLDKRLNELTKARTALANLLGTTADKDFVVSSLDDANIPSFSLDIPAKLLSRRPDLMAKESILKSYYAAYDEAKLSYFPDFTLSTSLGTGSVNSFIKFFSDPIGSLGAAITLPFLNFNEISLKQEQALKDVEIADLDFVSSYIKAVTEVYDAVSNLELYRKDVKSAKTEYELAVTNYNLYYVRYEAGLVSVSDFLDAADSMRSAEVGYLQSKRDNLTGIMDLMIALGGDTEKLLDVK